MQRLCRLGKGSLGRFAFRGMCICCGGKGSQGSGLPSGDARSSAGIGQVQPAPASPAIRVIRYIR